MTRILSTLCAFFTFFFLPLTGTLRGQSLDGEQLAFLSLINNYRAQNGAGALQVSVALQNSSQWMSNDMATKNYFSHTDSLGGDPFTRMSAFGYSFFPAGENIAAGNSTAQNTFTQWQTACDPDASGNCTFAHRQNMLNSSYVVIGIGRAFGAASAFGWYWTTDFGGVLDQTIGTGSSAPVINSFTASPSTLSPGHSTTLSWNVTGATAISINGGANLSSSGTEVVTPAQTTTYVLTASNSAGSVTAQVVVTVGAASPPVINSFTASPSIVTFGQSTILSWNVSGASTITINGSANLVNFTSAQATPAQTTTYIMTASNDAGSSTARIVVTVVIATAPVVNSFTATPSAINAGQSSTLSWTTTGATSVTLNGSGVATNGSITVTPAQSTTYTLVASNSTGSASAQTTVTVTPALDTQPPSAPTLTSVTAKSAAEVDLVWTASTDNVGVAGYQILRNGALLQTVSSLSYADTSVSGNTFYSYSIKAFDAAGNFSQAGNTISVTTPPPPVVTTCPGPAMGAFTGCYYNGTDLTGNPVLVRTDNQINFNWGSGSPAPGVTPQNFSVRWQGIFNFDAGSYTFSATMSDGFRLYIDGVPVRFSWFDHAALLFQFPQTLTQGNHLITLEYYESTGTATAVFSWNKN